LKFFSYGRSSLRKNPIAEFRQKSQAEFQHLYLASGLLQYQYIESSIMEKFIVIAIIVILAGIIIVLRLKRVRDKKNPPHSPLR